LLALLLFAGVTAQANVNKASNPGLRPAKPATTPPATARTRSVMWEAPRRAERVHAGQQRGDQDPGLLKDDVSARSSA